MKKLFVLIAVFGMLLTGASFVAVAQDDTTSESTTAVGGADSSVVTQTPATEATGTSVAQNEEKAGGLSVLHKSIKQKFIEGGAGFMGSILLTVSFSVLPWHLKGSSTLTCQQPTPTNFSKKLKMHLIVVE